MVGLELTLEQRECVTRALEGHNFSIFGEAGTGKSLAISEICKLKGAEVQVICSTGIACEVFQEYGSLKKKPITVHSFLGIGAAQEKFDSLIEKSTQNPDVRKRIKEAKCVIWDECSMSSSRVLELYQKITTLIRGNQRPFGGIQTIIVGDWLQLKPVSDKFDDGLSMFKSPSFRHLFPHTITLSVVHRQDATENEYKSLLRKLRVGICDQEVKDSISSLKRTIDKNSKKEVHLYFTNVLVDAHNSLRLNEIPEERVTFVAGDKGDVTGAHWKVKPLAHFKVGAPIMVLYNVNNHIHNGSTGVFIKKLNEDSALIKLDSGGQYVIKKVCWTNVDQNGKVIGSRYQIPLRLNWASTVHKSQGLTLDKVVIHSSFEFTGGLLYTALSRVRSIEDVQVLEFRPKHVRTRMQELEEIKNLPTYGYENCSCFEELHNSGVEKEEHYVDDISDEALYEMATQMFGGADDQEQGNQEDSHSENEEVMLSSSNVNMEEMLEMTEGNESLFSQPPDDFDYKKFLKSFLNFEIQAPDPDGNNFGILKNSAINSAVHEIDKFILLIKIVWYKEFLLLHHYLKENIADVRISTKDMKKLYQQCQDINRTSEYHSMLKICFQTGGEELTELAPHQMSIGFDILMSIFHNLLNVIVETARLQQHDELATLMKVRDMDNQGLGKVRFVGAWAIGKCLKKARQYVKDNLDTESEKTRCHVRQNIKKIQAIENTIVMPYDMICATTSHPETLHVTETRQYRTRGLIHVSDEYFDFILDLEQQRAEGLNISMLRKHGDVLLQVVEAKFLHDYQLFSKWKNLFEETDVEVETLKVIYQEVISRYINMGANQFLKNFRHAWRVKKSMAHRHMVMARKEKKLRKDSKVPLSEITQDSSRQKERSHNRLKELVAKFGEAILWSIYTRVELVQLCSGYGLQCKSNMNKTALGKQLASAISNNTGIPYPWSIGQLQALPVGGRAVGIRIRRI